MLESNPVIKDLKTVTGVYRKILLSTMTLIADRYENNPGYHWIDTKLNIITGKDFSQADPLRSKGIVYSWIQGRGLESLTLHIKWILNDNPDKTTRILAEKLERIVREVAENLGEARELNGGHLFFSINPHGDAIKPGNNRRWVKDLLSPDDPWNTSDIFASKGLFAASLILETEESRVSSIEYIDKVLNGIKDGNYATDQQQLAEGNPVEPITGRLSHAPWMLLTGSMTLLLKQGVSEALDSGIYAIRYILDKHVNTNGKWEKLKEFDFVEYISSSGDLWYTDGRVLSDPGHALEFVGLATRFLSAALSTESLETPKKQELLNITSLMFPIFKRNFTNGFNRGAEGIVKLIDLVSRQPVNSRMPWWSVPETMRAALGCYEIAQSGTERSFCMEVYSLCHNTLMSNYIVSDSPGLLAVQTRDENGNVIDSISAVPDADPGYHTGLSLIDCLEMIDEQ